MSLADPRATMLKTEIIHSNQVIVSTMGERSSLVMKVRAMTTS